MAPNYESDELEDETEEEIEEEEVHEVPKKRTKKGPWKVRCRGRRPWSITIRILTFTPFPSGPQQAEARYERLLFIFSGQPQHGQGGEP